MARPREFDMDQALDAAMSTFWAQGYEATSMTDLVEATGLQKGSLYKAFDDKHDLFMKSLSRYLDGAYTAMKIALSEGGTPGQRLHAWFQSVILMCRGESQRGCMAMNTSCELGSHDDQVSALLKQHHARASDLLTETIASAQQAGELRDDISAAQLSQILFTLGAGLLGTSKVLQDDLDPEQLVASALTIVSPPGAV
ncbi:MAG: TetR/AcrR family transcriptional regulator [Gemmatimonadetes bacterium]|jgi:TetR/AcrR family transcriptional regulator, transcriptional repressor for nem operon|nr:TetR/AcrR family transcriptional regulator [Gemmatimonadota bacterium]MBT6148389.1 TetR/AcrR family transcriptional regulator [Gemmatimonadota bacterium]MBT7861310.1 TetR/AcrR family transcriptional regulator [Gemmatimonadota bacterium]